MILTLEANEELRHLLQDSVIKCSERCLYQSAKWAAELLNSLPIKESDPGSPNDTEEDSPMDETDSGFDRVVPIGVISSNENPSEARLEAAEVQKYLLAKTYFDCREYDRCAAVFLPMTLPKGGIATSSLPKADRGQASWKGKAKEQETRPRDKVVSMTSGFPSLSQKALFLALYAKYMSGEKRKDEDSEMILGPSDGGATVNKELLGIGRALEARFELQMKREEVGQGWLEYLHGIVLAKGKNFEEAKKWFIKSVHAYSFNWGAWLELGLLLGTIDELQAVLPDVPQNVISYIFIIYTNQELKQHHEKILKQLEEITAVFPTSLFLKTQKALLYYHDKDFITADEIFSSIIQTDPLRIDNLDTYSNILFVMLKRPQLAFLAQLATAIDKFRPETCCVVGNYYAMKSEHEKAVIYFRRALTLDRNFLSAWTLMGHEYVELKNTQAAIECYRRAVDANRKDYRAWYCLGQAYEILEMQFYALFYYQRAAALQPYDQTMWSAVGSCLAKMDRWAQAIKAYKRALMVGTFRSGGSSFGSSSQGSQSLGTHGPMDPDILFSVACMYDKLGEVAETKAYLELVLVQEEGVGTHEETDSFLALSMTGSVSGGTGHDAEANRGVGVTATTSKARMWLAKLEFAKGGKEALVRALELAVEMEMDGYEVEAAKALCTEIRAKQAWEKQAEKEMGKDNYEVEY